VSLSAIQGTGGYSCLLGSAAPQRRTGGVSGQQTPGVGTDTSSDVLELSAEGQAASAAATSSLPGLSSLFDLTGSGRSITIEDMEAAQDRAQAGVQAKLQRLFAANGIDTSQEIRLQVGGDGQVVETSGHPQRAKIEKLFRDDPSLRDQFAKFNSLTEMIGAAREAIAFQAAYARNPAAAVAQYSYLFNDSAKAQASLSIQGDRYEALFERPGADAVEV
jgi:hypothetical protein